MKHLAIVLIVSSFTFGQTQAVSAGTEDGMSSTPKTGSMSTSTHQCGEGR
ncbi:hypothetical protein KO498_03245 [Lentibacter algarum]|nr:hypothetical protein [Lentibacter algarum]MBU2980821.1 hypothetical protein [Lentibacter algarum]